MNAYRAHFIRRQASRFLIAGGTSAMISATVVHLAGPPVQTTSRDVADMAEIIQSSDTVGLADSQLYGDTTAEIDANLDLLQSTGSNTVRIDIPWAGVEPLQGSYDWTEVDAIVAAAEARGMAIDADINSTPYWAASPNTPPISGPPASDAAYAAFAGQVASRYAGQISSYEIWNEPNSAQFWSSGPDASAYTALLKAAYPAIKAADPKALVVAGALGSVIDFGNLTENPVEFVSQVYADGGQGYFDALSFHPYSYTLEFSQGANVPNSALEQLTAIRQLMVANGDSAKLIWATEYGLQTSQVSQQTQASFISDFLNSYSGLSYVGPSFIYTVQQTTAANTIDPSDTYGVFNVDGTATPAEIAIANFIATHPVTTPPVVTPPTVTNPGAAFAAAVAAIYQKVLQAYLTAFVTALSKAFTSPATPAATPAVATTPVVETAVTDADSKTTSLTKDVATLLIPKLTRKTTVAAGAIASKAAPSSTPATAASPATTQPRSPGAAASTPSVGKVADGSEGGQAKSKKAATTKGTPTDDGGPDKATHLAAGKHRARTA